MDTKMFEMESHHYFKMKEVRGTLCRMRGGGIQKPFHYIPCRRNPIHALKPCNIRRAPAPSKTRKRNHHLPLPRGIYVPPRTQSLARLAGEHNRRRRQPRKN